MKLPNLPFGEKRKSDYFLALVLQDEKVNSFIFEKFEQKISILGKSEEVLETPVDDLSYEELLDACDKVVSAAEEQTQKDLGTLRTIFGLKQNWVAENKIKKEYIDKLQKVSRELELAPFGFLTITDAIVNLIQKEEGAPPSAILADIGDKFVTVSLIKAGKIVETKTSEIHQSPVFTVDTLLKHLTLPEILPSKVYFVGDEELTQEFIGHQWSKSLPFLHLPQISNLPESFIENAFVTGVAKEMKAEIVGEPVEQESVEQDTSEPEGPQTEFQKDEAEILKASEEVETEEEPKVEFVKDAQNFFGFVEGKDVAKAEPKKFEEPEVPPSVEGKQIEEIPQEVKLSQTGNRLVPVILLGITFIKGFLSKLNLGALRRLPLPAGGGKRKILPAVLGGLLLLLLIFYFFGLEARVQILATPRVEELNQTIVFSTTGESNFDENIIAGETADVEISGTSSTPATGREETGEKAKGAVTVYNFSTSRVTLPSNTTITYQNRDFVTLGEVAIASRSGTVEGQANVNVEAENFGTEYNLPSGIDFTVGNNSDLSAKNSSAFSGGTKEEITVVSEDDLAKLEEDLIAKLTEEAKTQILNKVTGGKQILPEFISAEVADPNFDREEGDEASTVSLSGRVSFVGLLFERNDILNYAEENLTPEDSSINRENLEIDFENMEVLSDEEVQADLNIQARILPEIDENEIAQRISRKSFDEASEIILSIPNIAGVEISFSPNIPLLPKILPSASKIKIEIVDNG